MTMERSGKLVDLTLVSKYYPVSNYSYPQERTTVNKLNSNNNLNNINSTKALDRSSLGSDASTPGLIDDKTDSEVSGDDDDQYHAHATELWDTFWRADSLKKQQRQHQHQHRKDHHQLTHHAKNKSSVDSDEVTITLDAAAAAPPIHPRKQYPALIPSPHQAPRQRARTDTRPSPTWPLSGAGPGTTTSSTNSQQSSASSRHRLPAATYSPFPRPLAARKPSGPSWESSRPRAEKPTRPPRPDERLLTPCLKQGPPAPLLPEHQAASSSPFHVADLLAASSLTERYASASTAQESEEAVHRQLQAQLQTQRQQEHEQRMRAQRKALLEQRRCSPSDSLSSHSSTQDDDALIRQHHREQALRKSKSKPSLSDYVPAPPPPPPCSDKPGQHHPDTSGGRAIPLRSQKSAASIRPVQASGEMSRPATAHGHTPTPPPIPSSTTNLLLRRPKSSKTLRPLDSIEMQRRQQHQAGHRPPTPYESSPNCLSPPPPPPPPPSAAMHMYAAHRPAPSPEPTSVFEEDSDNDDDDEGALSFFKFHKRAASDVRRASRQPSRHHLDLPGRKRGLTTPSPTTPEPPCATTGGKQQRSGADVFGRMLGRRSR